MIKLKLLTVATSDYTGRTKHNMTDILVTCRPAVESCQSFTLLLFHLENTIQAEGIKSWNETVHKHF